MKILNKLSGQDNIYKGDIIYSVKLKWQSSNLSAWVLKHENNLRVH